LPCIFLAPALSAPKSDAIYRPLSETASKERKNMPYDTHNRWVHGVLAEAAKTLPAMPWSRQAKRAKRNATERMIVAVDCPAYREQAFYE
jgi:hypothetical protein